MEMTLPTEDMRTLTQFLNQVGWNYEDVAGNMEIPHGDCRNRMILLEWEEGEWKMMKDLRARIGERWAQEWVYGRRMYTCVDWYAEPVIIGVRRGIEERLEMVVMNGWGTYVLDVNRGRMREVTSWKTLHPIRMSWLREENKSRAEKMMLAGNQAGMWRERETGKEEDEEDRGMVKVLMEGSKHANLWQKMKRECMRSMVVNEEGEVCIIAQVQRPEDERRMELRIVTEKGCYGVTQNTRRGQGEVSIERRRNDKGMRGIEVGEMQGNGSVRQRAKRGRD